MSVSDVSCSYGTRATGSVSLAVTNPADGAGPATYSVAVGARAAVTGAVADGNDGNVAVTGLLGGSHEGTVAGSDGTSATFPLDVPTCPAYEGVRVAIRKPAVHRLRVRLDNSRNSHETQFRVLLGGDTTLYRVPRLTFGRSGRRSIELAPVRVYVGQHLVARAPPASRAPPGPAPTAAYPGPCVARFSPPSHSPSPAGSPPVTTPSRRPVRQDPLRRPRASPRCG